jgi:hypothetical protein
VSFARHGRKKHAAAFLAVQPEAVNVPPQAHRVKLVVRDVESGGLPKRAKVEYDENLFYVRSQFLSGKRPLRMMGGKLAAER